MWSRPTVHVKCHEITFAVNWRSAWRFILDARDGGLTNQAQLKLHLLTFPELRELRSVDIPRFYPQVSPQSAVNKSITADELVCESIHLHRN